MQQTSEEALSILKPRRRTSRLWSSDYIAARTGANV